MPRKKIKKVNSKNYRTLDHFWKKIEHIRIEIEKQKKTKEVYLKELQNEENEIKREKLNKRERKLKTNAILELKKRVDELYSKKLKKVFPEIVGQERSEFLADNEDLYVLEQIRKDSKKEGFKEGFDET